MRLKSVALVLTAVGTVAVSGCVSGVEPPSICDASRAAFAIGEPLTPDLMDEAQDAAGAETVRLIRPGQVVTLEYQADRLNIELDDSDRVAALTCG
jgi:hypothetical protein